MPDRSHQRIHEHLQKLFEEIGRKFPSATAAERRDLFEEARIITAQMGLLFDERRALQEATVKNLL